MIALEIFSGVGGLSLGASMAGIEIAMAIEIDKHAAATFQYNHPNSKVIVADIREIHEINVKTDNKQKILIGGPPCQGFSKSNQRNRNKENKKNWLFEEYLRITKLWKPDWIVLENVQGLIETESGLFLKKIIGGFHKQGYTISYKVLNAKDFGVPQSRERLFIVGSLQNIKFEFPQPHLEKPVTVGEAFIDLPSLKNGNEDIEMRYKKEAYSSYSNHRRGYNLNCFNNAVSRNTDVVIERYHHIKQGGNWKDVPLELMGSYKDVSRCHTGIYHRLNQYKPSIVIGNYRKNMLIHPWENRGLSVREAARLQSFPDHFKFLGTLNNQQQQVGNAVPPLLAQVIFNEIMKHVGN